MQKKNKAVEALLAKTGDLDVTRGERLEAVARVLNKEPVDKVAVSINKTPETVRTWVKGYLNRGKDGAEWLASRRGPKAQKLIQAKGDNPEDLYQRLRDGARGTWMWLNNDRQIEVTLANVYNWRKKLLTTGTL